MRCGLRELSLSGFLHIVPSSCPNLFDGFLSSRNVIPLVAGQIDRCGSFCNYSAMADPLNITPISGALGARVNGLNLASRLDLRITDLLKEALLKYLVLVFPNQELTPKVQLKIALLLYGIVFDHA